MRKYLTSMLTALLCFLLIIVLNFLLPRMLPGDPIAYLTGMDEEAITPAQYADYTEKLHLNDSLPKQFLWYLRSLADGTLGYSYQKEANVASLIGTRLGATLQIALPGVLLSTLFGLLWGLRCGFRKGGIADRIATPALVVLNSVPTFLIALVLIALFCFQNRWFPYTGLSAPDVQPGTAAWFADRLHHLVLPVLTLTLAMTPSRFLLVRNTAAKISNEKYILYAKERGLSPAKIRGAYLLRNMAQPFLTMTGMSVGACFGGSLVVENLFSVPGMGSLLTGAVYTLDYPLMQGILFVTTSVMLATILLSDALCILIDPRVRWEEQI